MRLLFLSKTFLCRTLPVTQAEEGGEALLTDKSPKPFQPSSYQDDKSS